MYKGLLMNSLLEKFDGKKCEKVLSACVIVLIVMLVMITVITAGYTVNQSDDYSHAVKVGKYHVSIAEYFGVSIGYMLEMYKNWAGNYFSMFLQSFLSPLNMGGNLQLRVVMIVNAVLFFATFIGFLWNYIGKIADVSYLKKLIIILMIIYSLMNYRVYYEVFYWFSGATSYSFPLSFVYLSLILLLKYSESAEVVSRKRILILLGAIIIGFCGVGGSLTISGAACFVIILRILYLILQNERKMVKGMLYVFLGYFLGTFINFIAPGNYVRAERSAGSLGLVSAIKNTFVALYTELFWLFRNTNFFLIILILLIIGMLIDKAFKLNIYNYTVVSLLGLLTPVVSIFPVVLGYNSSFLANRTMFVIEQTMILSILNIAMVAGILISRFVGASSKRSSVVSISIIALCFMTLNGFSINNNESINTLRKIINGIYSRYYGECCELETFFVNSKGEDVVISNKSVPVGIENFSNFYLENSWVNEGIADYYGINSLVVEE